MTNEAMFSSAQAATATATATLPPRAGIAMLTLRLRTAVHDLAAAEQEEAALDQDAARRELRAKLQPLIVKRCSELKEVLDVARSEAAAALDSARTEAALIVAPAASFVVETPVAAALVGQFLAAEVLVSESPVDQDPTVEEIPVVDEVPVLDEIPVVDEVPVADTNPVADVPVGAASPAFAHVPMWAADDSRVWARDDSRSPFVTGPAAAPTHTPVPAASTVVIDADAFARVFATVLGAMLDERAASWRDHPQTMPIYLPAPVAAPVKTSFWSSVRHLDVLMLGVAAAIVLVVFAAWMV